MRLIALCLLWVLSACAIFPERKCVDGLLYEDKQRDGIYTPSFWDGKQQRCLDPRKETTNE